MNRRTTAVSQSLCFNFHNLVTVEVTADRLEDRAFFAAEYRHHLVESAPPDLPGVSLRFRRSLGLPGLPQGYTFHQHKLLARWGYCIRLGDERIELDVVGNHLAVPMVHHMLLHPSLRYLSSRQGVLLLHAGAVSQRGRSLIFTGHGGAGKTTITSLLLAGKGAAWSPHGDDYIFVAPGPRSLAYVTRSHLYGDLLRWVPEVAGRLSRSERARVEFFSGVRRWSGDRLKWAVRLPIERLWPGRELERSAKPVGIILLVRDPSAQRPALCPLEAGELSVDELIAMNFYEARYFLKLLQKCQAIADFPTWLRAWQERERALLGERLQEIPAYRLKLPALVASPASFKIVLVEELTGLYEFDNRA